MKAGSLLQPLLLIALTAALLTGCGFQLRGWQLDTNIDSARVVADGRNFLAVPLRQALETANINTEAGPASDVTIRLLDERTNRRSASVGVGARTAETETTLGVRYAIDDSAGQELVAPQWIEGSRVLSIDRTNIVGSNEEQVLLESEIRNDLVQQIVRSLNIALENRSSVGAG